MATTLETRPETSETGTAPARPRRGRRWSLFGSFSVALTVCFAALAFYPLVRVLGRLIVVDGELTAGPLRRVVDEPGLGELLGNTALIVGVSLVVALFVGGLLAWLAERTDARLPGVTTVVPMLPFLLPPVAGAIGWVLLLAPGAGMLNGRIVDLLGLVGIERDEGPLNIFSWWGMIFLYTIYQVPFAYLLVSAGLRNMDPQLEEQARVCGAGVARTLWRVSLPAVRPSLGGAALLMVWFGTAFFSVPAVLGPQSGIEVLSTRIVRLLTFTYPSDIEGAVALSLFMLVAVGAAWYLQKRVLRRGAFATVGGRTARASIVSLGRWRWPARALMLGYVLVSAVLPILALLIVALNGYWRESPSLTDVSFDSFRLVLFDDVLSRRALNNSLQLALVGATLGMAVAAVISLYVQRRGGAVSSLIDGVIKFPAALPNLVIAVGFVLAFSGPPFNMNGTFLILLLAYIVLFLPQGSVTADAAAAQVGRDLQEAAYVSGARGGRTFLRINLPLMLPGLVAGWALMFVWMVGELNASVILAGTRNRVIGFQILDNFREGRYGLLAALAIVLMVVNVVAVGLVMVIARRRRGSWVVPRAAV